MAEAITFQAICLCKASQFSFTVPTSILPIRAYFCHCCICRRTHGTLCTIHAQIPPPEVDLSSFTTYKWAHNVEKYFCSTCGAHMLDKAELDSRDQWTVAVGMVDANENVWEWGDHYHLESTKDGGLSVWLPAIDGKRLKRWNGRAIDEPEYAESGDWKPPSSTVRLAVKEGEKLKAHCRCGGVEFYISPPRNDEAHVGLEENKALKDKSKWYALHDVCNSCRLVSGCAVIAWAFPAISHITLADGSPYRPLFGTLKSYKSSPGVERTFCGVCGAVATYSCEERTRHVDIAVGLLDAESGVRAEKWLEWRTHRLAHEQDCIWGDFLQGMNDGLKKHEESLQ